MTDEARLARPGPPRRRRPGRRLIVASVAGIAVLLLAALAIDGTRRALEIRRELLEANAAVGLTRATLGPLLQFRAEAWPGREGYERLVLDVATAETHLLRARDRLGYLRWVAAVAGIVPVWGEQIAAAPRALDLGVDLTHHAGSLLREGEPLFAGQGKIADRAREVLVVRAARLDADLGALEEAAREAEALRRVRWTGPLTRAGRLLDTLAADLERVPEARALARAAASGLDPLLGFDGRRTYVVLGQNEQEIRATGGYAGTMGLVVIERGRLVSSDYRASTGFDPPMLRERRPPPEVTRYMGLGYWMVRDANWDTSFPVSAERVLAFLKADQGIEADGVIAVNTPMIQLLLNATGPMRVEGFAEPLTADNFLAQLEEEIFEPGSDSVNRKQQLMQPILRELIGRVQDASAERVPPLIAAFSAGARGRNVQVYARDPRSAALIDRLGVSGRVEVRPGRDFVAVIDSNVSYNKIQSAIRREITYLAREDGKVDLLVRWTNERSAFTGTRYLRLGQGGELWDEARRRMVPAPGAFGNFVRIHLPPGTTFEYLTGVQRPEVFLEEGMMTIAGLVVVGDGQTATLRLTYTPRGTTQTRPLGVDFFKQGGQVRDTLNVYVAQDKTQLVPFSGAFERDLSFDFPAR